MNHAKSRRRLLRTLALASAALPFVSFGKETAMRRIFKSFANRSNRHRTRSTRNSRIA
jgi:hypothetical protein